MPARSRRAWYQGYLRMFDAQAGICPYCREAMRPMPADANYRRRHAEHDLDATFDHKTPISKGGKDGWDNLQLVCRLCNHLKGDRLDFNG